MSILHKGTLTVVVATVIASGMILLSESSIAETKKDAVLAPPPGPFSNEELLASAQQKKSPVAPKAPMQAAYKVQTPTSPESSLSLKAAPVQPENNARVKIEPKPPVIPLSSPLKPSFDLVEQPDAPKLIQKTQQVPSGEQAPSLSKGMPPAPQYNDQAPVMIPPNAPIWSQQGQGTNFGTNHPRTAPNYNGAAMNNTGWGYPVQQYMYIPVPMMPSNIVAPQMPLFNRVPAPMPNYWVPTPAANKPSIQKNALKKDNN